MPSTSQEFRALDTEIERLTLFAGRMEPSPRRQLPAPRFERLLVALDASEGSQQALAWAHLLREAFGSEITLVTVTPTLAYFAYLSGVGAAGIGAAASASTLSEEQNKASARMLAETKARETAAGHDVRTSLREGHAGEEILKAALEYEADMILLGAGHGGLDRLLLGSIADHVKDHAHCSVLLAKTAPPAGDLLAAVDGSTNSRAAAHAADAIARATGRNLDLLHVLPQRWRTGYDEANIDALRAHEQDVAMSGEETHVRPLLRAGDARYVIPQEASERRTALLVLGTRGLTGLHRFVTGSVSARVSRSTDATTLLVRTRT